ncbi:MAG: N-6 DNA methylase [Syntrophaceae bacterium]|nr:N-6 DNA methylase [Syntrophaceae bacterium]
MEHQQFLHNLEKKLWTAADKLRSTLDAAQYKHAVLGLLFVKYVSDAFELRRKELIEQFQDQEHDYYLNPGDYDSGEEYQEEITAELEIRDYYTEKNVFWVPALARWETLQNNAKLPPGTEIEIKNGKINTYVMRSVGRLIDDALEAIEKDNPKLKGILNKQYGRLQIDQAKLGELIDLIATIPFCHETLAAKDILGHVYEYFLGQFALAEGKKGGQFYTPKSIVTLIVEMLQPFQGRVYDPCMGSGGFFVQSERFIKARGFKLGDVSIYGQEYNHTTWQLAAMNMVIRGLDFNFGKEPANTFTNDQHPDLRADTIMANPPFNMKEWDIGLSDDDPRWQYGRPPSGNANFAWIQHMIYHLAPTGSMGLLLANGSMSSNSGGEGEIRKRLIENDLVECMVALPGQLFTNTQIPACIWFLTRDKSGSKTRPSPDLSQGERGDATDQKWGEEPEDVKKDHYRGGFEFSGLLGEARRLRERQTPAEAMMWEVLRNQKFMGLKFRRQHQIGDYIVDFYCHSERLVIELDGGVHASEDRRKKDQRRDNYLTSMGFQVLRFANDQFLHAPQQVLKSIADSISSPSGRGRERVNGLRDRRGEVLFLDARNLGYMKDRVLRDFKKEDIDKIAGTFHAWQTQQELPPSPFGRGDGGEGTKYEDVPGFCYSATLAEIAKHDYVLTPGRYVGAPDEVEDGEPFAEKMARLTAQLQGQFAESAKLEEQIKRNLAGLGYEC